MSKPLVFSSPDSDHPWLMLRENDDDFGYKAYDLLRPPQRFWGSSTSVPMAIRHHVDAGRVTPVASLGGLLRSLPAEDNWHAMTRRSLDRLFAWFLVAEDPQQRMQAQPISALAHQASLVQHVLQEPHLNSVLIADEVGLGKTIEAALIIQKLVAQQKGLRVLYLAPARLVSNVRRELERLGLSFRSWVAGPDRDARLTDPLIVASIHRAIGKGHADDILQQHWDIIVVDECHHLSAWTEEGQSARRNYKLVDQLRERLGASGRLILMSGTPHQGHGKRFDNVLRLLARPGDGEKAIAGRVIYRTKEDVRDWDGNPLFPRREVRVPVEIDLGADHRGWLGKIHQLFDPGADGGDPHRAAGWRAGQALQWATSSIEAGLGYLVRQALRAKWGAYDPALRNALTALRPYREGAEDESVQALFDRVQREIGIQDETGVVEDIEDSRDDPWRPDDGLLAQVLDEGVRLLAGGRDAKWRAIEERVLADAGDEKVVLFAQPIETVTALARYLERRTGQRPAMIIGRQKEDERQKEIAAFWRPDGPQYLVSSRAGGEGINLQVARRIVHVDIPWNPMELEQRVGRVHRFMSRRKILVDTIVVRDSREQHMYAIAREKLREIASALSMDDHRFEYLFSRVMSLVQPEELQNVMVDKASGPLSDEKTRELAALVQEGHRNWEDFHRKFAQGKKQIHELSPGLATWDDLAHLATQYLAAVEEPGFEALGFEVRDDEVVETAKPARALRIGDALFACGDHGGMPVEDSSRRRAEQMGLNVPAIAETLRRLGLPKALCGAAHVRWPEGRMTPESLARPFAAIIASRVSVRMASASEPQELDVTLRTFVLREGEPPRELERKALEDLIRGLLASTVRREPEEAPALVEWTASHADAVCAELRRPSASDHANQIRHAVMPLLAAIVA